MVGITKNKSLSPSFSALDVVEINKKVTLTEDDDEDASEDESENEAIKEGDDDDDNNDDNNDDNVDEWRKGS